MIFLSRGRVEGWDRRRSRSVPWERFKPAAEMLARLLSTWSTMKTERYRGDPPRMHKSGQVATNL